MVASLTITDASKATWRDCGEKQQLVLRCSSHKTAHVYGSALLVLEKKFVSLFQLYIRYVRPSIDTNSGLLFVKATGQPFKNHAYYVRQLLQQGGITTNLTATQMRHAVAISSKGRSPKDVSILAKRMCHSEDVHWRVSWHIRLFLEQSWGVRTTTHCPFVLTLQFITTVETASNQQLLSVPVQSAFSPPHHSTTSP